MIDITQVATLALLAVVATALGILVVETRKARFRWPRAGAWDMPYHGIPLFQLSEIIDVAERRSEVKLSWGARQMLIIPVVETIELDGRVDWQEVQHSIDDIVRTIAESSEVSSRPGRLASSIAVIQSFFRRFCNIPPFCSRRGEQRG